MQNLLSGESWCGMFLHLFIICEIVLIDFVGIYSQVMEIEIFLIDSTC